MIDPVTLAALVQIADCRYGRMMFLSHDGYVGRSLGLCGEFSEGEVQLFRRFVHPGDLVLDVGANIGAHTVALARLVDSSGVVLAFEPIRFLYQLLCGNVALNGLAHVHTHHVAVGREAGALRVPPIDFTIPDNYGGVPLGGWQHGEHVPVLRLDDISVPRCDFIKIDVEGMEQQVIEGAWMLINRFRPVLYVENNGGAKGPPLVDAIRSRGYELYWHYPHLFAEDNYRQAPIDADDLRIVSHNMLCLPNGSSAPNDMEPVT